MERHKDSPETAPAKPPPPQPERPRPARIAVFGGSFDPVHMGHLFIAGAVLRQGRADEVLFVPARRPPHKLDRLLSPAKHRMAMLQEALAPFAQFSVSDIELAREDGPSYTVDTMETLRRIYNDSDITFLMGLDSLAELHTWYRAAELVNRNEFLIFPRAGIEAPSRHRLLEAFGGHNTKRLLDSVLDIPSIPVSSTSVRAAAAAGRSLAGLVPASVACYIEEKSLYRVT